MFYLIQNNVFADPRYDLIFETLNALRLPYEVVQLKPFEDAIDFATTRQDVFVYGSVKLARLATQYSWQPGSFYGGNHHYEAYAPHYKEHLLNYNSTMCLFSDALHWTEGEEKFIRPGRDAKVFTGKKFTRTKWEDFVANTLSDAQSPITPDTVIQVTTPKKIFKEARTWIVNGRVVTSSYYMFHGDAEYEENVSADGIAFAQSMAHLFEVARAFVMDICLTAQGWKIVEVNCINSAGFYKADLHKMVLALEAGF
ncbi:MAG: DUF4343 domain-containing protein [Sphingobacteriales bacterium]|nr:MAG: DUF4343 domain-containing protein [Sphingobacteriales bacterium]